MRGLIVAVGPILERTIRHTCSPLLRLTGIEPVLTASTVLPFAIDILIGLSRSISDKNSDLS